MKPGIRKGHGVANNPMYSYIQQFARYLKTERNSPVNTVEAYLRDLSDFSDFLQKNNLAGSSEDNAPDPTKVGKKEIRMYLYELHKSLTASSINRKHSALRTFFQFLMRQEIMEANPAKAVRSPKRGKRLPEHLTVDEAFALMDSAGKELPPPEGSKKRDTRIRDKAILELLYSTGARVSELAQADCSAIESDLSSMRLFGKGRKERIATIGEKAQKALKDYFDFRRTQGDAPTPDRPLFLNSRGERLNRRTIYEIVRKTSRRARLFKEISPHSLRHTFATHMLGSGAGLRDVQELLGHANLNTTVGYTHLTLDQVSKVYDKSHPHGFKGKERKKK